MTAAQQEPGQLIAAAGAFIRATLTGDEWTAQRTAALVKDAPGRIPVFLVPCRPGGRSPPGTGVRKQSASRRAGERLG